MPGPTAQESFQLAFQHHQANRLAEAESLYRRILATNPNHADALHMLGVLANQSGRTQEAFVLIGRAIQLEPGRAIYHNNLGLIFAGLHTWPEAADAFRAALTINPTLPSALNNLANVMREMGQFDEALAAISRAIELNAATPESLAPLGLALANRGRLEEAIRVLAKCAELRPDPDVLLNLGTALKLRGRLDESNATYARAIQLRPGFAVAHLNLATNFCSQALLDEALSSFREAVKFGGDNPQFHTALLNALHYHPGYDARSILREHLAWADRFANPLTRQALPHTNDRTIGRRIRLGYVSAEFRDHPVGRFLLPLFAHHDHKEFEIFCYSSSRTSDHLTQKLRGGADDWIDAADLSDEQLSQRIRGDRIDILVDLALHTAGSRLLAFARRPAPIQVTWLAYPGTSGMRAMDYRLSDTFLDLGGGDEHYAEKTIRLANCFWCYAPPPDAPPVNPLPALRNGYVTFGCFNNFFKVSPQTLELWARVLAAIPNSRMLIHSQPGSHLDRVRAIFSGAGVGADRLEFFGFLTAEQYWLQYHRIDITLDTLPYAGGTTTCDSLWMGAPVVTLAGRTAVGRAGASILSNAEFAELVAPSPQRYVEITAWMSADIGRLASLRAELRDRLRQSPLMDSAAFTRNVEQALRQLWRDWCAS